MKGKDKLLKILAEKELLECSYEEIGILLNRTWRQTSRIISTLQRERKISISKNPYNNHKRIITLLEDKKMGRLKPRAVSLSGINREYLKQHLIANQNKIWEEEAAKDIKNSIRIEPEILNIILLWNEQETVRKVKIPDLILTDHHVYHGEIPKTLTKTVSTIRRVLNGKFVTDSNITWVMKLYKNKKFTPEEIENSLQNYFLAAFSTDHLPLNKTFLAARRSLHEFFNNFAYGKNDMSRSLFLHFYENPAELTEFAKARIEKERFLKFEPDGKDREDLEEFTEYLIDRYCAHFIEPENLNILKNAAVILYDFAEDHGGAWVHYGTSAGIKTWPGWAINSLRDKRERNSGFRVKPEILTKEWFYNDILMPYIFYKGNDVCIDVEGASARKERIITDLKQRYPNTWEQEYENMIAEQERKEKEQERKEKERLTKEKERIALEKTAAFVDPFIGDD